MWRRFFPRTVDFLDHFEKAADNALEGARAFYDLISDYRDLDRKVARIKAIEHEGDRITHETLDTLNKTFITPIDREDIYALISKLDDILDQIDAAAHRLVGYKIDAPTQDLVGIAKQLTRPLESIKAALLLLDNMKNARAILDLCVEINRLENEADVLHRVAISNLFDNEKDPIRVIKLKEVYENLEDATDCCEDVANIIEAVVIKNS